MLRDNAQTADTLKAAFCAHMVLYLMDECAAPGLPAATIRKAVAHVRGGDGGSGGGGAEPKAAAKKGGSSSSSSSSAPAAPEPWRRLVVAAKAAPGESRQEHAARLMELSKPVIDGLYSDFSKQAERQGWKLHNTMLNPRETRLLKLQPLAV